METPGRLLLRAVCILLECILVLLFFSLSLPLLLGVNKPLFGLGSHTCTGVSTFLFFFITPGQEARYSTTPSHVVGNLVIVSSEQKQSTFTCNIEMTLTLTLTLTLGPVHTERKRTRMRKRSNKQSEEIKEKFSNIKENLRFDLCRFFFEFFFGGGFGSLIFSPFTLAFTWCE